MGALLLAAGIEVLSFGVSLSVGLPALWHVRNLAEVSLVYLFVFCCGALGARLSAIVRERQCCREFRSWCAVEIAKHRIRPRN